MLPAKLETFNQNVLSQRDRVLNSPHLPADEIDRETFIRECFREIVMLACATCGHSTVDHRWAEAYDTAQQCLVEPCPCEGPDWGDITDGDLKVLDAEVAAILGDVNGV